MVAAQPQLQRLPEWLAGVFNSLSESKKTGLCTGLFIAVFMGNQNVRSSDLLRDSKIGRSVEGNKTVTAVWFQ